MSGPLRRRVAAAALVLAVLALGATAPRAAGAATLSIDHVHRPAAGRYAVAVTALADPSESEPRFEVELDGRPARITAVTPLVRRHAGFDLFVVIDSELLGEAWLAEVRGALRRIVDDLGPDDRLRVDVFGARIRSAASSRGGAAGLLDRLPSLRSPDGPVLADALFGAVRDAARLPDERGGMVIVWTRGVDEGSRHGLLDVAALARRGRRLTPVSVLLVDEGPTPVANALGGLASRTSGTFTRSSDAAEIARAAAAAVERRNGRFELAIEAPGESQGEDRRRLEITATLGGATRSASFEFSDADLATPGGWSAWPILAVVLGAALLGGLGLVLARPRQACLLVVEDGPEEGCWYEVLALPLTLGAAEANDIRFDDAQVSRNHALLERRRRDVVLVDLNSEFGTFVNDERVTQAPLGDGDRVRLGSSVRLIYEARG